MTSTDREILVNIYESQGRMMLRLDGLESGQRVIVRRLDAVESEQAAMKSEQKAVREELSALRTDFTEFKTQTGTQLNGLFMEQRLLREKTDMLQYSSNLVLGAVAVFATVLGALPAIREWLRKSDNKPSRSELKDLMRDVVREMMPHVNN